MSLPISWLLFEAKHDSFWYGYKQREINRRACGCSSPLLSLSRKLFTDGPDPLLFVQRGLACEVKGRLVGLHFLHTHLSTNTFCF